MQIQHNISAAAAAVQHGIHSSNYQKSARKLGSGYRINSAADDAAQLSISEKMRSQIRGLNRAVDNAEEGANYIQTADGAMNEIHSMIHRMRELSIQSLNDTNTPQDRAAMALEFHKLQSEIDRIDTNTYYNTLPVFQEHESSYYQIEGNRGWASDQKHSIVAPDNSLNIHLPAGQYSPDTYTISVPDGIYTTQELIDEIDDAFASMKPDNPGFVLEFTQDGRCCLNFEGENGQPAVIDAVDGSLAYLIYDCYSGLSSVSLLGTTAFEGNWPLQITKGQNDELKFQIEPAGSSAQAIQVEITIPQGKYTRSQMIDLLNQKLSEHPDVNYPEVKAAEYGSNCIQITGGYDNSITGLKGNMFKLEFDNEHKYSSVFYDNIRYGTSSGTQAFLSGKAYYHKDFTEPIKIERNKNDRLEFELEGNVISIQIPPGEYSIGADQNYPNIVDQLNQAFQAAGADVKANLSYTSTDYTHNTYVQYNYLTIRSNSVGEDCVLKFDTDENTIAGKTFASLFTTTNYTFHQPPSYTSGIDQTRITGNASLSGTITIPSGANTLSLATNGGQPFTITIPAKTYASLGDLITELNNQLPAAQKGTIEFAASGNRLMIRSIGSAFTDITLNNTPGAYAQLFTGETEVVNFDHTFYDDGEESYPQGATAPDISDMATITLDLPIPGDSTTIKAPDNSLHFSLNGSTVSVTLAEGTYTRAGLIQELNRTFQAGNHKIEASLSGNRLTLTTTLTGDSRKLSIHVDTRDGGAWKAFVGTHPEVTGPGKSKNRPSSLQGLNDHVPITLDATNNTFEFQLSGNTATTKVQLPAKTYNDLQQLATDLQTVLDNEVGPKKLKVSYISGKGILLESLTPDGNFKHPATQNSSFYQAVFEKPVSGTHTDTPDHDEDKSATVYQNTGTHTFHEAFIIGRYDVTEHPIEIVSGMNDKFVVDLTYKNHLSPPDPSKDYTKTLEVTIPAGTYTGTEIADLLTPALNDQLKANQLDNFVIAASVGGYNSSVAGAIDDRALQLTLTERVEKNPDGTIKKTHASDPGVYVLEGIRGSAASSVFYKTSGKPEPSYVTGSQDISGGVTFPAGKNTFTFLTDGVEHSYTFPEGSYTADEVVAFLNDKFEHGDDNGSTAALTASVEDGRLKLKHKVIGNHIISEVGGSAKGILFYRENSRKDLDAFMLQVGALGHQGLELPRLRVGTAALKINSVTISRPKYAEKSLRQLDQALNLLSERRSTYGALHNRIEHLTANNRNTSENTQASESRMRDADMAAEMVDYMKHQILTNASSSILAQANQLPNRLISLLTQ